MTFESERHFQVLRSLRGSAIMVLVALVIRWKFHLGPAGEADLKRETGLSQNSVRDGLGALEVMGMAKRLGRYVGWVLPDEARQLPLVSSLMLEANSNNESQNLTLVPPTTTTLKLTEGKKAVEAADSLKPGESKNDSRSYQLLADAGIGDPMLSELAAMEHMTPEYITAHISKADYEDVDTGLLIHRMRAKDPMPPTRPGTGHYIKCECEACRRSKYLEFGL